MFMQGPGINIPADAIPGTSMWSRIAGAPISRAAQTLAAREKRLLNEREHHRAFPVSGCAANCPAKQMRNKSNAGSGPGLRLAGIRGGRMIAVMSLKAGRRSPTVACQHQACADERPDRVDAEIERAKNG